MLCRIMNSNVNKRIFSRGIRQCPVLKQTDNVPKKVETTESQISNQGTNFTPTINKNVSKFEKYLIYKYSSQKYASLEEVPDSIPSSQLNYAKDKARAKMTIFLIGMTILGCVFAIFLGKRDHNRGIRHTDEIVKKHSEYSSNYRKLAEVMKEAKEGTK